MRLICWFRRDLRLADNTMLDFAARETAGDVVPVFIFDDRILRDGYVGAAITSAMLEMLTDLDRNLRAIGSELIIRHGDPQTELQRLLDESQADGVVWNRDYTSFAVKRDSAVKAMLRAQGRF
nr:deoxyribodipyrimidine photo-lyase [Herpetosiphon sp.]